MYNSIWKNDVELPGFESLKNNLRTDVLIIGGGIAGLLTAYKLYELGVQCVLVEAEKICSGVTQNTTAKITSQHGLIYNKIYKEYGLEKTKLFYTSQQKALEELKNKCKGLDCDFEEKDSFVYSLNRSDKINEEAEILNKINADFEYEKAVELPFNIAGAIRFKDQAQFNPLKFLKKICSELNIYENTKVIGFDGEAFVTAKGRILSNKTIVTTHFPIFNKFGLFPLKMYQSRSYVLALKGAPDFHGMYIDENESGLSFRNHKDVLLLGGGSHRTGKQGGAWKELSVFKNHYFPDSTEVARWAAQDCMTLDIIPYIGRYSKLATDIYVATGFNKWGMTSSVVAASLLCDLVMGNSNEYTQLYSPQRKILHPQLFSNITENLISLLTPTKPRCPHMGCALKWNSAEKTWDCPCHGSRFSESGKLLENPATDDLK
ncbi:MAG: FAD-dependent oxidoreductase [Clostridia bacterium]|nr:FAD-dependent oxidoreductase [Clostridia bacterium]